MKTYLKPSIEISEFYPDTTIAYGDELLGDAEDLWGSVSIPQSDMFIPFE